MRAFVDDICMGNERKMLARPEGRAIEQQTARQEKLLEDRAVAATAGRSGFRQPIPAPALPSLDQVLKQDARGSNPQQAAAAANGNDDK